jgi:hypothetical protein
VSGVVVLTRPVEVPLLLLQLEKLEHVLFGRLDPGPLDGLSLAGCLQIIFDEIGRIPVSLVGELASTRVNKWRCPFSGSKR